jgi:NADH-quinone oxidoreductase subunit N
MILIRSTELLTLCLALELFSVALYGLAAYHLRSARSAEAGLKYFLMGAFVSSFMLYGVALLFGETGSTRIDGIAAALAAGEGSPGLLLLGSLLVTSAFAFKLSLVPFHAWAPDVYQGAPTPFVAFRSVAPKVASAVVLVRLVTHSGLAIGGRWPDVIALLAVVSMLAGNLFALVQRDIKRMLAYSGVAHMGYLMIPLAAPGDAAWRPVLVYLVAYALMNAGAFGRLTLPAPTTSAIAGLSGWVPFRARHLPDHRRSLHSATAGFIGSTWYSCAIQHQRLYLALVGISAGLIGVVVICA